MYAWLLMIGVIQAEEFAFLFWRILVEEASHMFLHSSSALSFAGVGKVSGCQMKMC